MCGITGIYLKNTDIIDSENDRIQFDRFFDELLLGIEERGRDSTGFVAASGTKIMMDKDPVPASTFVKKRKRAWLDSGTRMVLGHARLATQGSPDDNANNHPVMYGTTFVTHNGHIHNDDSVYDDLKLERYAEVDSSAIAASLHHHGFAKAKDALEMLGGGFAIAAIDPHRNPETLLLAKGGTYPLAYLETKHVLVWASTQHAILDAWGAILGTPPAAIKVKYLNQGDMLWVRAGETELERSAFKPKPRYTTTYQTSSYTGNGRSVGFDWDGWPSDEPRGTTCVSRPRGVTTLMDNASRVAAMRGHGGGRAITFDRKDSMTDDQRKMYRGKWITCMHCKGMVADFCIVGHEKWGEVCWDCLTIGLEQSGTPTGDAATWSGMDEDDLKQLDDYAAIELDFMDTIVADMAKETGLSERLIFWLLTASGNVVLGNDTSELKEKLVFMYADKETEYFDSLEDDNGAWLPIDASEVKDEDIPIPPERQLEESKDKGKCDHCKKKAGVIALGRHGKQHRWCKKHIDKCFKRGCHGDPVAWGPDGRRWCHPHTRHVKGLIYLEKAAVA